MSGRSPLVTPVRLATATALLAGVLVAAVVVTAEDTAPVPVARPVLSSVASEVSGVLAERQSALLVAEDERLLALASDQRPALGGARTVPGSGTPTVVLTPGPSYGLAELESLGALVPQPDGSVLLTRSVFVAAGARLDLDLADTTLRLSSGPDGFVSLVAWRASLTVRGADGRPATITSWDPATGAPDTSPVDGRAYIRSVSGEMDLEHVSADSLGFWSGRTGGVAWTGSSSTASTGSVSDSSFTGSHYGVFASRVTGLTVSDTLFAGNVVDGLSLHRGAAQTTVTGSRAQGNGRYGFAADLGSEDVVYADVVAAENGEAGISFSGTPLAEGQTAAGASQRTYGDLQVTGGTVRDNGGAGIRVVDGNAVSITGTQVIDNSDGIVLRGTSAPTSVSGTVVRGGQRFGVAVRGGSARVEGNDVSGARTGIRVEDADVEVVGNTVRAVTAHGVSVVGAATGSALVDNEVAGRGPSALDLYRLDLGVDVEQAGNDADGWTRDRDDARYWAQFLPNHPMLLLWVLVLGMPLALTLRARRRRVPPGTPPYRDELRRVRTAHRVHVGRRPGHPHPAGAGTA